MDFRDFWGAGRGNQPQPVHCSGHHSGCITNKRRLFLHSAFSIQAPLADGLKGCCLCLWEVSSEYVRPKILCSCHLFIGSIFNASSLNGVQEYKGRSYPEDIFRMLTSITGNRQRTRNDITVTMPWWLQKKKKMSCKWSARKVRENPEGHQSWGNFQIKSWRGLEVFRSKKMGMRNILGRRMLEKRCRCWFGADLWLNSVTICLILGELLHVPELKLPLP